MGEILNSAPFNEVGFLSWYSIKGVYKSLQLGADRLRRIVSVAGMMRNRSSDFLSRPPQKGGIRKRVFYNVGGASQKGPTSAF